MQLQTLTGDDVQRIHNASVKVLEDVGVWFAKCPQVVDFLVQHGCQRVDSEHVRVPRELVAECLARPPDREGLTFGDPSLGYGEQFSLAKGASHFTVNGNAYMIYDHAAGKARDCVETDSQEFSLIAAHLKHMIADPCDLVFHSERSGDGRRKQLTFDTAEARGEFFRRWLAGRSGVKRPVGLNLRNDSTDEAALTTLALAIREGAAALEQRMAIWEQYIWFNPLSPLQWHPEQSPIFLELLDPGRKCTLLLISPEIMMGATAPVTMAGALVQHNAEVLMGMTLAQLARPGVPTCYGCVGAPMDMRSAEVSHGSFETALFHAAAVQMADHYGMPSRICPGNTNEKAPGVRAAVEQAAGVAIGMAAGGNIIMTGLLDSTLMLSYEHLLVADEIIAQTASANRPITTDAESLAMDVIAAHGHPSAGFITSEHTRAMVSRDIYYSDYCGRVESAYEDWYSKAHRKVNEILTAREGDVTDPAAVQRLAAVQARLAEDDHSWRSGREGWWRFYVQDFV
ncbi:MAG: trimethylamine methyltransferase family protein [Planctomycetota bacterium]|jgi:trimethylamine--corrinoid protein Co-methyltransferase